MSRRGPHASEVRDALLAFVSKFYDERGAKVNIEPGSDWHSRATLAAGIATHPMPEKAVERALDEVAR